MSNLQILFIDHNLLSLFPTQLTDLLCLEELSLGNNLKPVGWGATR